MQKLLSYRYLMILQGAAAVILFLWPEILWMELIIAHYHIESATDWIAVWLFVARVGALIVPPCTTFLGCFKQSD